MSNALEYRHLSRSNAARAELRRQFEPTGDPAGDCRALTIGSPLVKTMNVSNKSGRKPVGFIFRTWITREGVRDYAKDHGLKAWRIPIFRKRK